MDSAENEAVRSAVAAAVGQAYDAWAAEHPSLAAVIDRLTVTQRTAESLRTSQEFRDAVAGFHRGSGELELLNKLVDLAGPILTNLLGL